MKKLIVSIVIAMGLFLLQGEAHAIVRTISWDPVTTYVDNTTIVSPNDNGVIVLPVMYAIIMDGNPLVNCMDVTGTSCTFEQLDFGVSHVFNARAKLQNGSTSDWSPDFIWVSPIVVVPGGPNPPIILQIIK